MADQKLPTADDLFGAPTSGGNALTTAQLLIVRDQNALPDASGAGAVATALERHVKGKQNTYSWYELLQLQIDYWANLVPFRFKGDAWLNLNAAKALRVACMFGLGGVKHVNGKIVPLAVQVLTKDEYGYPSRVRWLHADNVLWNQANAESKEPNWTQAREEETNDDLYVFQANAFGWGMMVKWRPFLRQLEDILIMLCASSYVSFKRVLYNVADTSAYDQEIGLLYSPYSAVLCNVSPDGLGGNKFKEFDVGGAGTEGYFMYLDKVIDVYYNLLGRRSNVDFKPERNTDDEIGANQEAFDVLQNEWKTQARELLDWIAKKTGIPYTEENQNDRQRDVQGLETQQPDGRQPADAGDVRRDV